MSETLIEKMSALELHPDFSPEYLRGFSQAKAACISIVAEQQCEILGNATAQKLYEEWIEQQPAKAESVCALAHKCFAAGFNEGYEKAPKRDLEEITPAQMDAEDNDPVKDAEARGYAAGYKACATVREAVNQRLFKAAKDYFERYAKDEADDVEYCCAGEQQHLDAIALRSALKSIEDGESK
jgi:hypothetical protein